MAFLAAVMVMAACTATAAASSGPAPVDLSAVTDVRSVDFYNAFPYEVGLPPGATVVDGYMHADDGHFVKELWVEHVFYGDLVGNGLEDAVVVTSMSHAEGPKYYRTVLYSIGDAGLESWGEAWASGVDRGEVISVTFEQGQMMLLRLSQDGTQAATSTWAPRSDYQGLERVDLGTLRDWADLRTGSVDPVRSPHRPDWAQDAWRATVMANRAGQHNTVTFEAGAGWSLQLGSQQSSGFSATVRRASGALVGLVDAGGRLQLDQPGSYTLSITIEDPAIDQVQVDVAASDLRTLLAPTWESRNDHRTTFAPAERNVSLSWPEFTTAAGAADLDATNKTIRSFVATRTEAHRHAVTACAPDERAIYSLGFTMRLVSYDLVAIEFDEFICLCESGDSFENHLLVIDLNTGQEVAHDRIVNRQSPSFAAAVAERVETTNYYGYANLAVTDFEVSSLTATSLNVRSQVESEDGPFEYVVAFELHELTEWIDPAIAQRAASGKAVALPIIEECGC